MQDEDDEATGDLDYIPDTTEQFTFTDAQLQEIFQYYSPNMGTATSNKPRGTKSWKTESS